MFVLREYDREEQCMELVLDDNLFHRALAAGEKRYHVKNPKAGDFDIVYLDNNDDIEPLSLYPAYLKGPHMAKYLIYDETDQSTLYLDFFEGLHDME